MKFRTSISCFVLALLLAAPTWGDELQIVVNGVEGALLNNVQARTQSFRIAGNTRLLNRQLNQMVADAEVQARSALRPFGYYHAEVSGKLVSVGDRSWQIVL